MPLMRDKVIGYDNDRMVFKFAMLNVAQTVLCTISSIALDELAGKRGTPPSERSDQFLRLREAAESLASALFDAAEAAPVGVVCVFAKHIRRGKPPA
jgi:hypothetical protein